ncbi:MAG TPA: bifunctional diguanylate cyclase/phosphodiesterase [Povalibacter sp.]|nr:bifunctional diguanylate cyclase/phosphodiesterase [Povalibacter sp.]
MHVKLLRRTGIAFVGMSATAKLATLCVLAFLIFGTTWLVYATGGLRLSFSHLMYVPIVLAGIAFGVYGGLLAALVGGLALGPLMPLDTATGEMQVPLNWLYRIVFFAFIGGLVGTWAQLLRRHVRELEWLHEHHQDTGLLNLAGLIRELDSRTRAARDDRGLVVSITQLNTFLEIQNTFGAAFGMKILAKVVERARGVVPPGSLVALIQPDRLAIVVEGESAARLTRERLEEAVSDSYVVDGVPIHVEASIGLANFPTHARTAEELLQKASIAMHWAASNKTPIQIYDVANDTTSRDNLLLLGALPEAIERGELQVWHQAKISIASGNVIGTEALLRWNHPQRGVVQPGNFIPQVEETTLINPVTQAMIAAALADAGAWRAAGHELCVSINLSVRNLRDRTLLEVLEQNVRRNRLEPRDVDLEITESAVMADPDYCIRLISLLRGRGYGVSIDDFGVGHSSLAYLQKLDVSSLKIDQAFIRTLAGDPNNQKIVRSILHLAKSLGLRTVAEGIDDAGSLELLREWGCDYGQGYFIHRPAPATEVSRLLAERTRTPSQAAGGG